MSSHTHKYGCVRKGVLLTMIGFLLLSHTLFYMSRPTSISISGTNLKLKSPDILPVDWRPDQALIDKWENTAPFMHCPRGSNPKADVMMKMKLKNLIASNSSNFCTCPAAVTFLLVTNRPSTVVPVSEQLYQLCGCRYVHIRLNATLWPGWQWIYKVGVFDMSPLCQTGQQR